ncbi:2-methylcitrate synthase/citrate synthase II [Haloterrigena turkmenica DSM 5511]|uniref:Citrate synthase n=1 Tax=Haloterrigena turkmenica (strain ATCC 51198 / DSM 5511 / JCM 9101 / NCIMB 13204 / VKM B-1734 / 4k) TaxID=543526 RepID=D2RYT5_HALTV|nr:citrate synthase [Haloterrigena turkmenica]ADB61903.1 2-methylcitrate synthase/citrate synthase II [Haloterrigena turkmenica DSM 5511]
MADDLKKGLEGVLVAESGLSSIDGDAGRLIYRGYSIEDLARGASYEEVLYLLWHGELPTADELEEFSAALSEERGVHDDVLDAMERLAAADERPMAALRTAVSMFSAYEPESDADPEDLEATMRKGRRITAKIPTALAAFERYRQGEEPVDPHPELGLAANFLYMLTGEEPGDVHAETFDQALILHADHGLNASTFTSMVIGSTMADIYSAVTGGVSALSGPLHGGANQDVMEVLFEIDESNLDPLDWVEQATDEGRRIPGFGHRVYNVKDPRAKILQERSKELAEEGDDKWYEITTTIEQYLSEEKGLAERGIAPNVDFYSGSVYYQLGIPIDMYTPIFAMSRAGGWVGHVLEYQEDNRLIRPLSRYTGPTDQEFVPVDER